MFLPIFSPPILCLASHPFLLHLFPLNRILVLLHLLSNQGLAQATWVSSQLFPFALPWEMLCEGRWMEAGLSPPGLRRLLWKCTLRGGNLFDCFWFDVMLHLPHVCRCIEQDWASELICRHPIVFPSLAVKNSKRAKRSLCVLYVWDFLHCLVKLLPFSMCNLQCCGYSCVNTSNTPQFPVCFFVSVPSSLLGLNVPSQRCLLPDSSHVRVAQPFVSDALPIDEQTAADSYDVTNRLWHHRSKWQKQKTSI